LEAPPRSELPDPESEVESLVAKAGKEAFSGHLITYVTVLPEEKARTCYSGEYVFEAKVVKRNPIGDYPLSYP